MSLPWLKDDYKRPGPTRSSSRSQSRSRSRSGSRTRRPSKGDPPRKSLSRSRSRSSGRDRSRRGGGFRGRGNSRRGGGRSLERGGGRRRHRSDSSSSGSRKSISRSPTRLAASERPKYVNARVFVAKILSKDVTKEQLATHFEKYGNVVDVLIHAKNYAFVQYLKHEHAKLAVEGENGSVFNGMRIDVKMANENRNRKGAVKDRGERGGRGGGEAGKGGDRMSSNDPEPYGPDPFMHAAGRYPPPFPPLPGEFGPRDPRDPFFPDPYRRPYPPTDPWLDDPYRRDPYGDPFRDPFAPRAPLPPTECVVFFVNRQLQTYAETVERRIKDQSILASSAIIPEGRTAPQMIEDLTTRGGLFAIFINAQNEVHRSLTLNILHGTPQEHRNMPLNDAISLIGRSFEKYVEELRAKANSNTDSSATTKPAVPDPPPSEIGYLLNLLADSQVLTIQELNTVIQHLQKKRDKLIEAEKGPVALSETSAAPNRPEDDRAYPRRKSPERPPDTGYGNRSPPRNMDRGYPDREPADGGYDRNRPPADDRYDKRMEEKPSSESIKPSNEELTKKILSIFQGSNPSVPSLSAPPVTKPAPTPAPAPPPPPTSASSNANLINFDNPNVQKALDNLIQSGPNLLKNFAPKMSSASTSLATESPSRMSDSAHNMDYGLGPSQGQGRDQMNHGMGMAGQGMDIGGQGMMDHGLGLSQGMSGDGQGMDQMNHGMGMAGHGMDIGGQGMMDQQGMYNMDNMHGNMGMSMQGPQMSIPQMPLLNPLQQMVSLMMPGMGIPRSNFGGQGFQGPPLPRGAPPPPPPPPQQHF